MTDKQIKAIEKLTGYILGSSDNSSWTFNSGQNFFRINNNSFYDRNAETFEGLSISIVGGIKLRYVKGVCKILGVE